MLCFVLKKITIIMSKFRFKTKIADSKLSVVRSCNLNNDRIVSNSNQYLKITLRSDEDVKRSQVKGYSYLVP